MALLKVTTCDTHRNFHKTIKHTTMKISSVWTSVEVQAQIETTPIQLVNKEPKEVNKYYIIKIKIHKNPSEVASEMYELKIVTFEHGQPE